MAFSSIVWRVVIAFVIVALLEMPNAASFSTPSMSRTIIPDIAGRGRFRYLSIHRSRRKCDGSPKFNSGLCTALNAKLEDDLGNVFGGMGREVGKSIDWFFDTSHLQGAKAWRLQEVPGEADSVKWRERKVSIADQIQDEIQSLNMKTRLNIAGLDESSSNFFSETEEDRFSMSDEDLGSALTERLGQLATGISSPPKYGLYHDMAMKCDMLQLVSDKKLVSLNIYYSYVGQINPKFQYSEADYMMKLDALASLVNQWQQQDFVRQFFREKPTAYRGLPSRPRWDTAVSIRLYKSPTWNEELVGDWFLV